MISFKVLHLKCFLLHGQSPQRIFAWFIKLDCSLVFFMLEEHYCQLFRKEKKENRTYLIGGMPSTWYGR